MMSAAALLRGQFRLVHGFLDAESDRFTSEAAASYAAVTLCEDVTISGVLSRQTPLALSKWRGRTGLSELPQLVRQDGRSAWARRVCVELDPLRSYARAVHAATDAYLAGLAEEPHRLRSGQLLANVLVALLLRVSMTRGEIAAITGSCGTGQCQPPAR